MSKFLFIFIIVFYSANIYLYAQPSINAAQSQYSFKYLNVDQGLSNNNILSICQDSKGLIWIGTLNGLNKFNGQTIVPYWHDSKDSTSVSSNTIYSIFLDSKKNLWIGGSGGLDLYNADLDNFIKFKHPAYDSLIQGIYSIVEDVNGKLWFGGSTGLYTYDLNTKEFQFFDNVIEKIDGVPTSYTYRLLVDKNNKVWMSMLNNGIKVFNQQDSTFKVFNHNPNDNSSISGDRIERIFEDRKGNIWFGTLNEGLNLYNPQTESFKRYIPDKNNSYSTRVRAIFEDLKGDLFIGTRGGIYRLNKYTDSFEHYAYEGHNFSNISQNSIMQSFIDKSGTLWIGTFSGGVNYTHLNKKEFVHYIAGKNDNHYLSGSNIYGVIEDPKGNLWVGGDNGLNYLDRGTHTFKYYKNDPTNPNSISYNDIKDLEWDENGNLWIASNRGGLNYYDVKSKKFTAFKHDPNNPNSIVGDKIYCLMKDSKDNLWIIISPYNDFNSLYVDVLPKGSDKFIHLEQRSYFGLVEDSMGNVYIGGLDGFWMYARNDSTFKYIRNKNFIENTNTLHIDTKGVLWIGSAKGLARYDAENQSFNWFFQENGFPISQVFGILEDESQNLWVSTNTGLVKISNIVNELKNNKFRVFDQHDGLQSKQFNYNSFYKCKSGEMAFGGTNGLNTFFPNKIVENKVQADVLITDLKILNKSVPIGKEVEGSIILNKAIMVSNEITLGPKHNVFSLEFASPQNANPGKNTFKIKLDGFDNEWQYKNAANNSVTYTNLPAGKYTFMVNAANTDGIWRENPVALDIVIIPPFWKTWWFTLMLILFISFSAYLFYNQRVKQFKINERQLKKAVEERTSDLNTSNEELQNQKYEILTQNEEIQSQNEELQAQRDMIEDKNKLLEDANENLEFLNQFGEQLTSVLNISDVFHIIEKYFSTVVEFDIIGFGILNESTQEVLFSNFSEKGQLIPQFSSSLDDSTSIAAYCYKNKKEVVCNDLSNECLNYITEIKVKSSIAPQSVLYFPLTIGDKIIGILTLQNYKTNAFSESSVSIIQKLLSYITIAVDNAFAYDLVKNQKEEIEKHKEYLEDIVAERTNHLEIAKNKAEESDRLKSAFLANMSHEIRTPLNAIIGFTNLLNDSNLQPGESNNYSKIIKSSGITLLQLINDIVDFSKIEAGQLETFLEPFNIDEVLLDIYYTFNENNKNPNVEFVVNNEIEQNLLVITDKIRLTQILNNLLSNAFKFTTNGLIEFGIKKLDENNKLVFYVKDSGIGIDEKHYNIIFNRFTKIDENTSTLYRGVGLGLAITKHLVERLGGEISLLSEVNKGTEFTFTIPHKGKTKDNASMIDYTKELLKNPNWSNKVFLIADDEETNLLMIKKLLAKTQAKIYDAVDGEDAIDKFKKYMNEIDVVLLDIKMPKKDGIEVFKEIRAINKKVIVIAQTAYAMANEEKEIRDVGFSDYVSKPIEAGHFFRMLDKYLNKHH